MSPYYDLWVPYYDLLVPYRSFLAFPLIGRLASNDQKPCFHPSERMQALVLNSGPIQSRFFCENPKNATMPQCHFATLSTFQGLDLEGMVAN